MLHNLIWKDSLGSPSVGLKNRSVWERYPFLPPAYPGQNPRYQRNFEYIVYEAKTKKYYPDFIINNTYIEIKNYWTPQVQAKIDYFPDELQYKILYKEDLKTCIEYCILKYGKDFTNLYDSNRPS